MSDIACDLSTIPEEELEKHRENSQAIFEAVVSIMEIPDGYTFELPPESGIIEQAASFIARERLCCPFFKFKLEIEPEEGPLWLDLSGCKGVKSYIKEQIVSELDVPVEEC